MHAIGQSARPKHGDATRQTILNAMKSSITDIGDPAPRTRNISGVAGFGGPARIAMLAA